MKITNPVWSQIVFLPRNGEEIEVFVLGKWDGKDRLTLQVTSVTDMDGEIFVLWDNEDKKVWDCLYDSLCSEWSWA